MMHHKNIRGLLIAGGCAGAVNGLLGAGGGMILVPLLQYLTDLDDREIFFVSIATILPVCLVSLWATATSGPLPWSQSFPYLIGSGFGGWLAAKYAEKIPVIWLHKGLGILILWGGIRYLC